MEKSSFHIRKSYNIFQKWKYFLSGKNKKIFAFKNIIFINIIHLSEQGFFCENIW